MNELEARKLRRQAPRHYREDSPSQTARALAEVLSNQPAPVVHVNVPAPQVVVQVPEYHVGEERAARLEDRLNKQESLLERVIKLLKADVVPVKDAKGKTIGARRVEPD